MNSRLVPFSALALGAVILTGCARGSVTQGPGGIAVNPPPSAVDEPPPPPPPPAPPPPPPPPQLPPLSSIVVNLDDNHQVGVGYWPDHDTASGGQGQPIGKYVCWPHWPPETYHVHSHLSIFLDGQALAIPDDLGVVKTPATNDNCYYTLHTHDRSGKLHVEAPTPEFYSLGDVFQIWGQPLQPDNVAGITGKPIVIYITDQNGVVTLAQGDWHDIELLSHREITIQIGTTISEIPNFFWTAH